MRITRTIGRFALPVLLLTSGMSSCSTDTRSDAAPSVENVVNIYNWADYIGSDTLAKFEAEYNIKVNYDLYDASSVVDVKLLTGNSGYDVILHSNQYASRLAPIGVFEKLDLSKLPNARHLDPEMMARVDVYELVRGYMLPYHWGTTGYAWLARTIRTLPRRAIWGRKKSLPRPRKSTDKS